MTAITSKLMNSNFLTLWIAIALSLACFSLQSYSQEKSEAIEVTLKSNNLVVSKDGTFNLWLSITNKTETTVYLISRDDFLRSYNATTRDIGIGYDIQPSNFHYFEFPKLRKIKPKRSISLHLNLPVADWKVAENGEWHIAASIGVLEKKKLDKKLKDLGYSVGKDEIQMTATDFLDLQMIFYSNSVPVTIRDE